MLSNSITDRVRVSVAANNRAKALQNKFVELGPLASIYRIAALLSLHQNGYLQTQPEGMEVSNNLEVRLSGPLEIHSQNGAPTLFPTLVQLVAGKPLSYDEIYRQVSYHIHLGSAILEEMAERADTFQELYALLLEKTPPGLSEAAADWVSDVESGLSLKVGERLSDNSEVRLALTDSSQTESPHACIVGVSGQGKTEFALDILHQIREQNPEVSFTILDYKGDLSDDGSAKRRMFEEHMGCETIAVGSDPIPMPPFQNISGYDDEQYALGVADLFGKLYPRLGSRQRLDLRESLTELISMPEFADGFGFQSLADALENKRDGKTDGLTEVISNLRVIQAFQETPTPGARTRLTTSSLLVRLNELVADALPAAFLIISRLYDEMKQLPDAGRQGNAVNLRHVIFIDEAHHYLAVKSSPLARIIREGRSKGVAVFLATQSVSDLASAAGADYREFIGSAFFFKTNLNRSSDIRALLPTASRQVEQVADRIAALEPGQMLFNRRLQKNLAASTLQAVQFYKRSP